MICICLDDMVIKRAKYDQIAVNTKAITSTVLYTTLGVLVGSGAVALPVVGNYIIIMSINKAARIMIRKTGVVNKIRGFVKKRKNENALQVQ